MRNSVKHDERTLFALDAKRKTEKNTNINIQTTLCHENKYQNSRAPQPHTVLHLGFGFFVVNYRKSPKYSANTQNPRRCEGCLCVCWIHTKTDLYRLTAFERGSFNNRNVLALSQPNISVSFRCEQIQIYSRTLTMKRARRWAKKKESIEKKKTPLRALKLYNKLLNLLIQSQQRVGKWKIPIAKSRRNGRKNRERKNTMHGNEKLSFYFVRHTREKWHGFP